MNRSHRMRYTSMVSGSNEVNYMMDRWAANRFSRFTLHASSIYPGRGGYGSVPRELEKAVPYTWQDPLAYESSQCWAGESLEYRR
jgi:hypothetical protein